MTLLLTYLLIGTFFMMLLDMAIYGLDIEEAKFTNGERVTLILIWPIALFFLVLTLINTRNR